MHRRKSCRPFPVTTTRLAATRHASEHLCQPPSHSRFAGPSRTDEPVSLPHRLEAGVKQFSADASGASGTFPGAGHTLAGTPVPKEVPPAERNWLKLILIALVAGWWAYSRGQGK